MAACYGCHALIQTGPDCGIAVCSPSNHLCSSSSVGQQQFPSRNFYSNQLHLRVTAFLSSVNHKHSLSYCRVCCPKYELPSRSLLHHSEKVGGAALSSRFHQCKKGTCGHLVRHPGTGRALATDGNGRTSNTSKPWEKVVCFGEMLIDFVPTVGGLSLAKAPAFKKAPGGAPANVAVGIARLGGTSAFMGKVGDDEFGYMLVDILKENRVESRGVRFDPNARTALAFVTLREDGERGFMFYRNPSADMLLTADEVDMELVRSAQIFHYGSISLITDPCRTAHMVAMEAAKKAGTLLSYDPNLRLPLWESQEEARTKIKSIWDQADIIKVSEEEISFLTEGGDPCSDEAAMQLWHPSLKLLLVTEGSEGCRYYGKNFHGRVAGMKVTPVDTTGAGDAFVAGMLYQLVRDMSLLEDEQKLREALKFANACGAITTTERGAIPALPDKDTVLRLLNKPRESDLSPAPEPHSWQGYTRWRIRTSQSN